MATYETQQNDKSKEDSILLQSKKLEARYPDRTDNMKMLQSFIAESIKKRDYETANLNFAKLIESMRQQNENYNNSMTPVLKDTMRIYAEFRERHGLSYPSQFMQNIEGELDVVDVNEYGELLKAATKVSKTDINKSIRLIKAALKLEPNEFQAHKKLCSYLQKANKFKEAEKHLWTYYSESDEFYRSQILDYLAVLHKKERNELKAIELESHSIWYRVTFNDPTAYFSETDYLKSICFNRKYKDSEFAKTLLKKIIDFWGKDWLVEYWKKHNNLHSNSLKRNNTAYSIKEIKKLLGKKDFDSFISYLNFEKNKSP